MERAEKLNMEKLEQVTGGNYGGSSGNWVSARVKASGGLYRFSKSGSKFSNTGRIFVPCGEYITVDKGRAQGVYVIAFYIKADTGVLNSIDKQNKACNNRKSFLSGEHM